MNIFIYYLVCSSTLFMYKCKRVKINRIIAANSVLLNWTEHSTYLHLTINATSFSHIKFTSY